MEYSNFYPQQDLFLFFGIWNIPYFTLNRFFSIFMEYGIFQEYSKKIVKHSKMPKFWNMEFLEYSKKSKTVRGYVKFNHGFDHSIPPNSAILGLAFCFFHQGELNSSVLEPWTVFTPSRRLLFFCAHPVSSHAPDIYSCRPM